MTKKKALIKKITFIGKTAVSKGQTAFQGQILIISFFYGHDRHI